MTELSPLRVIPAYRFRRLASRPVACKCEQGSVAIQTSIQAGGMTSDLIRESVAALRIVRPSEVKYLKPAPDRVRRIPAFSSLP